MSAMNSSVTNVVLLVSLGVLIFIMIFCFAKRQISRFALKSSKSAHETIGHHAPTALLLEIERRLSRVKDICIEPRLIPLNRQDELKRRAKSDAGFYYYRMLTLDSVSLLYAEVKKCNPGAVKKVGVPLRVFLFEQRQVGCLEGIRLEVIEKFCSSYDHARHNPKIFTKNDYKEFQGILKLLLHYIHNKYKLLQLQQQTPSPAEHSERSNGSQQKLIDQPATTAPASKLTWLTSAAIKSPFQSMTRALTEYPDVRSRLTTKMYTATNFTGRSLPTRAVPRNDASGFSFVPDKHEAPRPTNIFTPHVGSTTGPVKTGSATPGSDDKSKDRPRDDSNNSCADNKDDFEINSLGALSLFTEHGERNYDNEFLNILTNNRSEDVINNSVNVYEGSNDRLVRSGGGVATGEVSRCGVAYHRLADAASLCEGSVNEAVDCDGRQNLASNTADDEMVKKRC